MRFKLLVFNWSLGLLLATLFFSTCFAYHNQQRTKQRANNILRLHYDVAAVTESVMCGSVDINWSQFALQGAVAGGCRALSRGLTFPFDTLKTLEQSSKDDSAEVKEEKEHKQFKIDLSIFKLLLSKEYFRGVIPAVASAVPANAVFFVVYNYLQTIAASDCILHYFSINTGFFQRPSILFVERLMFSAIATLPQNAIKIPAELIKQRAQVQPDKPITYLLQQATKPPLGIIGLYQGGGAQLIREIPYNAIQMATFQSFKEILYHSSNSDFQSALSPASVSGILGLLAAAIAAILTQPADVIKTRLMTAIEDDQIDVTVTKSDSKKRPDGIIKTTKKIIEKSGWQGLFVGLVPRLILVSLGGSVYFWAAEVASEFFEISLAK
jgi:solute carrier family 25 (mitochondrial thiamine pyrophosphate transporter), member 19